MPAEFGARMTVKWTRPSIDLAASRKAASLYEDQEMDVSSPYRRAAAGAIAQVFGQVK